MRITWVTPRLDNSGGSAVIIRYANMLSDIGHEVTIVTRPRPRLSAREAMRKLVAGDKVVEKTSGPLVAVHPAVRTHIIDGVRRVEDSDVCNGDVVIATFWTTAHEVASLSPSKGRKFYFMQDYGGPHMPLSQVSETWRLPLKVITISKYLKDLVEAYTGRGDVELISNAVCGKHLNYDRRAKGKSPTIGFVYRPEWFRGADIVSSAFQIAKFRINDLRLVMFGNVPPPELGDGVSFAHNPSNEAARQIYRSCDAWIFASRLEGFGLPILEAMSQRTPVIATRAGASPELVDELNGFPVEADPLSMAEQIICVAQMAENKWLQKSDRAFNAVKDYRWENALGRLIQLFAEE